MRLPGFLFLSPLVLLLGCGPATLTISGTVNVDKTPLAEGSIAFDSPDGSSPSIGGRIENGRYLIQKVPTTAAGSKIVRINAAMKTGRQIPAGPPSPPGTMVDEVIKLPPGYNEKSTLKADLAPGKPNLFDFDLSLSSKSP